MNKPLKYLPSRLTASAILATLEQIGITIPLAISASAKDSRESLSYAVRASRFSLDTKALDEALARTELGIAERLRFKFAAEQIGIY
jgi:hypothetical protein